MKKFLSKFTAVIAAISVSVMGMSIPVGMAKTDTSATTYLGENLLADYDSGFEGTALSSKWTAHANSKTEISTTEKQSGDQSLKVTVTEAQQIGPTAASITLKAGKTYLFSAYIKPSVATKYRLRVNGSTPWRSCTANKWNHLGEIVSVATDTSVSLYFQNSTGATYSGTVYLDNIEVYEIQLGDNLLGAYDSDFENTSVYPEKGSENDTQYWAVRAATAVTSESNSAYVKSGSKSVKVDRDGTDQQVGLMAKNVSFSAGKRYYASAWVYSDKETKYRLRVQADGFTDNNEQAWITAKANTWTQIHTVTNCTADSTGYFYIQASDKTGSDIVYIDKFELYDVTFTTPKFEAATVASPLNGAAKVSVDTDLKLVFTQKIPNLATNNIIIDNGATVGIPSTTDNKNFTIDIGTLTPITTYTVKITGVVDVNGNTVEDTTFEFTTAYAGYENIIADYDPGFEGGEIDSAKWNKSGKVTRTTAKAHTGAYSALSSGRVAGWNGPQAMIPNIEEDTEYFISAWVYTDVADTATIRLQGADAATIPDYTNIATGQWNHLSAVINTSEATGLDKTGINGPRFYIGTSGTGDIYVDDFEVVKIGKLMTSENLVIDNTYKTIDIAKYRTESYADMSDIANDIDGADDFNVTVNDADQSGNFSDGDTVVFVSKTAGADGTHTYAVDVHDYYEGNTEALIVKGSDEQGDEFCKVDTITKAGDALVEYRVTNYYNAPVTPVVIAVVYDENDIMRDIDIITDIEVPVGEYRDFEMEVVIPSAVENGKLQIMVWNEYSSIVPLLKEVKEYTINTNEFSIPYIIADNMILQRNATATIFGKAPEGATVTATLSGGITGNYTVPQGDNEFFVPLEMGEYSTTEQTLTISAVDADGKELGSVTKTGVLVGDVYYGSGQSNMQREFGQTADEIKAGKSAIYSASQYSEYVAEYEALADYLAEHNVRFFQAVTRNVTTARYDYTPEKLAQSERWRKVNKTQILTLNEGLCYMAEKLSKLSNSGEDVPIGMVAVAQGGTKIAKWVSRDAILSDSFDDLEKQEYETNVKKEDNPLYWAEHTDLYYDGVRSVMPYTVKAAVWYQGESDTTTNYDKYLKAMIEEMRVGMRNQELPYLIVQFPGYDMSLSDSWPEKRLQQWNVQEQLDNVYTIITNDTGDNSNIHPANKNVLGDRLARTVLANVFKQDIAYTGPTFKSVNYGTGSATVTVDLYGGTLKKYEKTVGAPIFQVTTDGGETWTVADSISVDGNTITVKDGDLTSDVNGVRYAYAEGVLKCIYAEFADGAELPLVPFDTTFVPHSL